MLLVGLFAIPMVILLRMSLNESVPHPYSAGLTFQNYGRFFTEPLFQGILWRTFRLAIVITALSLLLGSPLAYVMWRARGRGRTLLLGVVLLPLFTNVIARLYGWQIVFSGDGPVNDLLLKLRVISDPARLNFTFFGATVGLTYVAMPYFILILFSTLEGIDWTVVEAARSLGAGRLRSILETVLPLSSPGLAAGIGVAFAWGMGAYAEPVILGSPKEWGIGYEAWRTTVIAFNWPFAAVLSLVMILSMLLFIVVTTKALVRQRHLA